MKHTAEWAAEAIAKMIPMPEKLVAVSEDIIQKAIDAAVSLAIKEVERRDDVLSATAVAKAKADALDEARLFAVQCRDVIHNIEQRIIHYRKQEKEASHE